MVKLLAALLLLMAFAVGAQAQVWDLDSMVHPDLRSALKAMPEMRLTPELIPAIRESQAQMARTLNYADDSVKVYDEIINDDGLRVRVYVPKETRDSYPALLWIQGGGRISGLPELDDWLMFEFIREAGCIAVAPVYRLAPEHPYPADVDDCMEALRWMVNTLPVRKDRVAVGGLSAGGGLAASVALKARDERGPALCFELLLYPQLDYRNDTPSMKQIADKRVWNGEFNALSWRLYLNGTEKVSEYASPAIAQNLAGLPEAYIMVGTLDPFRDEAITYAQRLMQSGVGTELHVIAGGYHCFEVYEREAPVSKRARREYTEALSRALKKE